MNRISTLKTTIGSCLILALGTLICQVSTAQVATPHVDDEGKIRLPNRDTLRDFRSRLPLQPHRPDQAPGDEEIDRTRSLTLFGQGRLAYQHEKYERALAAYQRAWLWNPDAKSILDDIVAMAFHLDRQEIGIRYAILASENSPRDPALMQQLAMILAQQGKLDRGKTIVDLALQKHARQAADGDRKSDKDIDFVELHLSRARICMLNDQFKEAADSFDVLANVIKDPKPYDLNSEAVAAIFDPIGPFYGLMAESYTETKQFEKAKAAYAKLNKVTGSKPLKDYHQAVLAFHQGDIETSKTRLTDYFRSESSDAGQAAYLLLEDIIKKEKPESERQKTFIRSIQKLTSVDPANAVLAEFAGKRFVEAEKFDDAQEVLEPLLAETPTIQTFSSLLRVYQENESPGKIVAMLGTAVETTGDLRLIEEALSEFTKDEAAVKTLITESERRRADKVRPMAGTEAFGIALVCLAAEDFAKADVFFDTALKQTRDEDTRKTYRLTWAEETFFADHIPAARKHFSAALESPPEEASPASIRELLSMAHELDGKTDEALAVIEDGLAEEPDSPGLLARRGWVHYHSGSKEKAEKSYQDLIERYGDDYSNEGVRRVIKDAKSIYSNILVEKDDIPKASELLLQVLDEYPEDTGARNDLGYLWADANVHVQRALKMAQQAISEEPDNAAYLDTLAWAYYRVGENEKALELLERATGELEANDSVILDHLGDVYQALSRMQKAKSTWERAIKSLNDAVAKEKRPLSETEEADLKRIRDKINRL